MLAYDADKNVVRALAIAPRFNIAAVVRTESSPVTIDKDQYSPFSQLTFWSVSVGSATVRIPKNNRLFTPIIAKIIHHQWYIWCFRELIRTSYYKKVASRSFPLKGTSSTYPDISGWSFAKQNLIVLTQSTQDKRKRQSWCENLEIPMR